MLPHVSDWAWGVTEAGVYFGVGSAIQYLDTAIGKFSAEARHEDVTTMARQVRPPLRRYP